MCRSNEGGKIHVGSDEVTEPSHIDLHVLPISIFVVKYTVVSNRLAKISSDGKNKNHIY